MRTRSQTQLRRPSTTRVALANEGQLQTPTPRRRLHRAFHSLLRARLALIGVVVLLALTAAAIFGPALTAYDPNAVNLAERLKPPVWQEEGMLSHPLGTDQLGRDTLTRLLYGARISLLVGLTVVFISGFLGFVLGLPAGYYGGRVDSVIMRLADIQLAFPFILLAVAVMSVLGAGLVNVIIVLGISMWVTYGRVIRGQVISLREKEFVESARAIGSTDRRIITSHILPNIVAPVIVIASFAVSHAIIAEASLSFLGLGVPASITTWGGMLAEGREYIRDAWWLVTMPGLAIMLTVLATNTMGDWLRDFLDPHVPSD